MLTGTMSGRSLVLTAFLLLPFAFSSAAPVPVAAAACQFVLGFKALHDALPDVVGDCLANEHFNPANGDSLQETMGKRADGGVGGLLVWRKADNFTAFTDGYRTWVNGPFGVQQRLNTERFDWEALAQLRNAEYSLPVGSQDRTVRLSNGKFDSPADRVNAGLIAESVAVGDLNGDGTPDAVALLYLNTGGSGTFEYLLPMVDRNGLLVQAGREFLGDRVKVNSITIGEGGVVKVDMITQGPNDPLCCPTTQVVKEYKFKI